ncbi:MAG: hypothetical protein Q9214_004975 [Letrouitia sp. 1 TL-2023]
MPDQSPIVHMPSFISNPGEYGKTVPSRGRSTSPIRRTLSAEKLRRAPSRTFIPPVPPIDIMDFPKLPHPRIGTSIRMSAPIFLGGATAEGDVCLVIDGGKRQKSNPKKPPISVNRISVSLVGIERSNGRTTMFNCLMTDLIDKAHPPPETMAPADQPTSESGWQVVPSASVLPFRIDLPVTLGPVPFKSKKNSITFLVSVLLEAKIGSERVYVRNSEEVAILAVYDHPVLAEKALVNLPTPLVVTDEIQLSHQGSYETIVLTVGLHRQTWISGYLLFFDVRISNRGTKTVKKVQSRLERSTFVFSHAAPTIEPGLSDSLRLPERCEKKAISRSTHCNWQVAGNSEEQRTCVLEIPPGLVSIETGRSIDVRSTDGWLYSHIQLPFIKNVIPNIKGSVRWSTFSDQCPGRFFGVRFFLNVKIKVSFFKSLKVQLPVTIIHPSSIDIPPNALAQVATTIENKHRHHPTSPDPSYLYQPGQAFLAPRRSSHELLLRKAISNEDINDITAVLERDLDDNGPRRRASTANVTSHEKPSMRYRSTRFLEGDNSFLKQLRSEPEMRTPVPPIPSIPQRLYRLDTGVAVLSRQQSPVRKAPSPPTSSKQQTLDDSGIAGKLSPLRSHPPSFVQQKTVRATLENAAMVHRQRDQAEPKMGPRLQRSTSGLGFSASEDGGEDGGPFGDL